MANRHRGEIDAVINGKPVVLCLTLGALAELESAFDEADMLALAERFDQGRLKAKDAIRVITAGLHGAGEQVSDEDVARMQFEHGIAGAVDIVARLLQATFANPSAAANENNS